MSDDGRCMEVAVRQVEEDRMVQQMSQAHALLERATCAEDAKRIADVAHAALILARRQKLSQGIIGHATVLKVDAVTAMGEFLLTTEKNTGSRGQLQGRGSSGGPKREPPEKAAPTYAQAGIGKKEAAAAQALARLKKEAPEAHEKVRQGKANPQAAIKQNKKRQQAAVIAREPPPLPEGPFRVLVIDPPWEYAARGDDPTHRAGNPYPSMSIDAIRALPVAGLACDDAILWLWATNAHLPLAFGLVEAWGFTYKTCLTWVKNRFGTGDWLRGQTEHCLLAVRGKPAVVLTNQSTALAAPMRKHSEKPEEFYALVEALCPGSKVELFSRKKRKGWNQHGDELR